MHCTSRLKVVDLGFARELPESGRCHTLLGTPEYLSPEVFRGEGHGTPSDIWVPTAWPLHSRCIAAA